MSKEVCESCAAKEAELSQFRELLEEAVELLNGYEQMRQNVMGAVSLAVNHGMTWPQDQIDLAMKTIAGREAFLAKIAPTSGSEGGGGEMNFKCHICGEQVIIAPNLPEPAVCPEHCPDHIYSYIPGERCHRCDNCGQEPPDDWFDQFTPFQGD